MREIQINESDAFSYQTCVKLISGSGNFIVYAQRGKDYDSNTDWEIDKQREYWKVQVSKQDVNDLFAEAERLSLSLLPPSGEGCRDGGKISLKLSNSENSVGVAMRLPHSNMNSIYSFAKKAQHRAKQLLEKAHSDFEL